MEILLAILFAFFAINPISSDAAKILSIYPVPSPSHYIFGGAILKELAKRGHEVTSVGVYPQKKPLANFRDIFLENNTRLLEDIVQDATHGKSGNSFKELVDFVMLDALLTENTFAHPEFQELLKSPEGKFDLLFIENMFVEAFSGLGEHFNIPMIGSTSFGTALGIDDAVGNISPASIVPNPMLTYASQMTFFERVNNFLENIKWYIVIKYYRDPVQRDMYYKNFPNAKIAYEQAITNFSLLMINQHHSLSFPRPYVPNVVEVGGVHIPHKPDPLPADMQKFLDSAKDGVIYFSMGSNIKSKDLALDKRNIFLNVFRKLKQKVLWKFEEPNLPGKPDNVFISPWVPQFSVLAHPNVKVFITHGGLLSTTEAIFYGVPILGIPMFADQPRNIGASVRRGIALSVEYNYMTEQDLSHKLNELIYNAKYKQRMTEVSHQYHDKPMTAMESAMYWIEYVLKHKGAQHLQNAGIHLNLFQYYSVDVVAFLISALLLFIFVTIRIVKTILSYLVSIIGNESSGKLKRS